MTQLSRAAIGAGPAPALREASGGPRSRSCARAGPATGPRAAAGIVAAGDPDRARAPFAAVLGACGELILLHAEDPMPWIGAFTP